MTTESHHGGVADTDWQRRCALCGALDAEGARPTPGDDEDWQCDRCYAVRALWEAVPRRVTRAG